MGVAEGIAAGRFHTIFQTLAILVLMSALFGLLGYLIFGTIGLIIALLLGMIIFASSPKISPRLILRMYGARLLTYAEAPALYDLVTELSRHAGVGNTPRLYYIPSTIMNAFSVGSPADSAIALTDGLLRHLSWREIAGVMGHEVGHVRHNDLWIYAAADVLTRITSALSLFGQLLVVLYLPVLFLSRTRIPVLILLVLIFAPTLSMLMQLALSRTREFAADLAAVELTGDPAGLASALQKMDQYQRGLWDTLLLPGRKVPEPSALRTHPRTEKRVERLQALAHGQPFAHDRTASVLPGHIPAVEHPPRWHWLRPWH